MNYINFKFVLLNTNNKGYGFVYLQVINNRKVNRISTKIKANKKNFCSQRQRFISVSKENYQNNLVLEQISKKVNKYLQLVYLDVYVYSFKELCYYAGITKKPLLYKDFVYDYCTKNCNLYAKSTLKKFKTKTNKVDRFKPNLKITDIDSNFLNTYFNHLLSTNNKNTAYSDMKIIKKFIRIALQEKIISENPFENFQIKTFQGNREFLNITELKKLEEFYYNTSNLYLKNVLQYFLFACYTGLRFQDVLNLTWKNIDLNENTITIVQQKTGRQLFIPISDKAKEFLNTNSSGTVFNVLTNQKTNLYLKHIAELCNINKTVTFHVARHTFATLAIHLNIPISVISELLGHTNIKTTQIYAKITNTLKTREMQKFNTI